MVSDWMNRPDWRVRWGWAAFLGILVGAGAASLLRGGGEFYFGATSSDLMCQFYPWRVFASRWLHRGIFPFWDPHVFDGYPVLEMQQMALLYPPSIFSALAFGARFDLLITTAFHVIVAGVGLHVGMRRCFHVAPAAAVVAAATYVYGATFAMRVGAGHLTVLYTMTWIPIGTLAVFRLSCRFLAKHRPPTRRALMRGVLSGCLNTPVFLAAVLANAFTVLAGSPQYVVYLFWCEAVVAVAVLGLGRLSSAAVLVGVTWCVAALVSCPLWLPTMSYLPYSSRAGGIGALVSGWLDRANMLLEMVLPFPFGDDLRQPHLHMKNVWETCSYPGTITLVLALPLCIRTCGTSLRLLGRFLARRCRRSPSTILPAARVRASVALVFLGFYLCWAGWLPGFSHFREPQKARTILTLGLSFCAAVQLNRFHAGGRCRSRRLPLPLPEMGLSVLLGGGALACLLFFRTHPGSFVGLVGRFGQPFDVAAQRFYAEFIRDPSRALQHFQNACATVTVLGAAALLMLILLRRKPGAALAALAGVACLDPFLIHVYAFRSRNPYDAVEPPKTLMDVVGDRILASRRAGELPWRVVLHPDFANQTHYLDGFWEPAGYDPLMPRGANNRTVLRGIGSKPMDEDTRFLIAAATGRRYDLFWLPASQVDTLTSAQMALHEYPGVGFASIERNVVPGAPSTDFYGPDLQGTTFVVPPRYACREVDKSRLSSSFLDAISAIASASQSTTGSRERRRSAREPGESLTIKLIRTPNEYAFSVKLSKPALLVVRTTWLPGWNVRITGGRSSQALCANHWMPATVVPAGAHEVCFYYRPRLFGVAVVVSALTCAALLVGMWVRIRREEHGTRAG